MYSKLFVNLFPNIIFVINLFINFLLLVCFSGLNFQDLMARQGAIDSLPKTPFIMGVECAGDIEQVGEGVENFKVRNWAPKVS